ncbi:MAG: hypothetical protein NTU47_02375 [Ignavibacteriales bacterium]|nr:hypothetical protein [Ignavibacteriales bacterium]
MTTIEQLLRTLGPSLSSTLCAELVSRDGVSNDAARKRISRVGTDVRRLGGVRLRNRESILFLDEHLQTEEFHQKLAQILKSTNGAYANAINGLNTRGGIMPVNLFPTFSGLPIRRSKGHLMHCHVEETLVNNGILNRFSAGGEDLIALSTISELSTHHKALLIVESVVISSFHDWLTKTAATSFGTTAVRGIKGPQFGPFQWDIVGPSYLTGLTDWAERRKINGFIVADFILDRQISRDDLTPFLSKVDVLLHQRHRRFIAMLIADSYATDALNELRKRGILLARPATFFGEELAHDLRQLILTIENAAAAVVNDPENVFALLKRIARIEGASLNLRGVLLEFIVARLYSNDGYNIDMRQQIVSPVDRKPAEIDIKAVKPNEVVCIECKAKLPNNQVTAAEITEWLATPLTRIKGWLNRADSLPQVKRFEFYSSSGYDEQATTLIEKVQKEHQKQPIRFYSGADIDSKLHQANLGSIREIFNEHFKP